MTAVDKKLYIEQGATFTLSFTWHRQALDVNGDPVLDEFGNPTPGQPYNLTGCTARMQVRKRQGDPPLVTATSASTGEGANRIYLGGSTGRIEIVLTDEDTDLIASRSAVYDLEIEWPYDTRSVTIDVTSGSMTATGVANTFSAGDSGASIDSASLPAGTKIQTVVSDTEVTLSAAATATATESATITRDQLARPRVDRLLQGAVEVSPNVTQVDNEDPVIPSE